MKTHPKFPDGLNHRSGLERGLRPAWMPMGIVALLAMASLLVMLWISREWKDAFRSSVPALDNLSQSRVYAAEAAAATEKVLAGDDTVQRSDVLVAMDRAFLALEDCRSGTSRLAGVPGLRPQNAEFLAALDEFEAALREVKGATQARLDSDGPDGRTEVRQRQALHRLKNATAQLDVMLSRTLGNVYENQQRLLIILTSLWGAFAFGLTGLVWIGLRQRHASERRVRDGLELLRTIVERAQVAVVVLDRESKVRLWNGSAERIFGWSQEEVLGKSLPCIPSDVAGEAQSMIRRGLEGASVNGVEVHRVRRDGTGIDLELFSAPLRVASGEISGLVAVLADITERKRHQAAIRESAERFRQVVENSPFGIFIQTEDRFHYLNPAAVKLFGGLSEADLVGARVNERFHPESRRAIEERRRVLNEDQQPVPTKEEAWLRLDGTTMLVEASATPFQDGERSGALVFFTDISQMRLAQEEKRKVEAQFFQAQKMESVGRLAGGIAHDFNNLLTVINGYSKLLIDSFESADPRREQVAEILGAGERATGLTRQLLAFSRRQIIEPVTLCINDVVRESRNMMGRLIGEDIKLVTELSGDLWPVLADRGQIHQILLNLAVNARDAMPAGGRIVISTRNVIVDEGNREQYNGSDFGPHAELTFSDNGSGMTAEVLAHVFEPFFTTKAAGSGTGLGLATVYGIVKQSGGAVYVQSAERRGTTFRIVLPRAAGNAVGAVPQTVSADPAGGAETILVAEDNPEVRRLACEILTRSGYRVLEASDAAAALKVAESHLGRIDLLLTDVVMPGGSGKDLSLQLRAVRKETRCLFMSGYPGDVMGEGMQLDAETNFVAKPFTPAGLAAKVRDVLDRSERI